MKTIVDTNGKVLQTGDQGLQVVSEDGVSLLDIGEVSDSTVIDIFIRLADGVQLSKNTSESGDRIVEILLPRTATQLVVAKNVGTINMNNTF